MADFKFEITKHIGVLSENSKGWKKEFNLVSWNGREPKYDIREWAPDHESMNKGVTLTEDELDELMQLLTDEVYSDEPEYEIDDSDDRVNVKEKT